ncbi:hypothetical protein D3P96_07660 [Weissella viridescens]|uniref:Uncharacterized protein n=1 Tax=Weissella viridescens TaxID=1629 RepID=A0A3P2RE32_WEIVI|nr:hypothetical protein [Weissella viridescens]RRG17421.1 hypothetical protein D3P96_07660 [Weissella viridescens]
MPYVIEQDRAVIKEMTQEFCNQLQNYRFTDQLDKLSKKECVEFDNFAIRFKDADMFWSKYDLPQPIDKNYAVIQTDLLFEDEIFEVGGDVVVAYTPLDVLFECMVNAVNEYIKNGCDNLDELKQILKKAKKNFGLAGWKYSGGLMNQQNIVETPQLSNIEKQRILRIKSSAKSILNYVYSNGLDKKGYGSIEKIVKQMDTIINATDVPTIKKYAGFAKSMTRWYVDDSTNYQSPLLWEFSKLDDKIKKL